MNRGQKIIMIVGYTLLISISVAFILSGITVGIVAGIAFILFAVLTFIFGVLRKFRL